MKDSSKATWLRSLIVFIIGVLSCSNVFSAFIIGSTPVMLVSLLPLPLLLICLIQRKGKLIYTARYMTKDLLYTGFFIFLSVISVLLFNPDNLYQWFVGCINVLIYYFLMVSIIECKTEIKALYWGILIGIFANFIVSVYALFLYNSGVILDLTKHFPGVVGLGNQYLSNAFRARGLFREQGHLMRYLAVVAIPVTDFAKEQNKIIYILSVVMIAFMMAFTGSSSVAIFVIGYLAYFLIVNGRKARKILLNLLGLLVLLMCVFYFGKNISFLSRLSKAFQVGFTSIFDLSGANLTRLQGMRYAIRIAIDYPIIGCGWNGITKVLIKYGVYGVNYIMGSYSGALSLIAELGLASGFYFHFLLHKGISLIKCSNDRLCVGLGISLLIYFALFCLTDYVLDASVAVLLALALIYFRDNQIANE